MILVYRVHSLGFFLPFTFSSGLIHTFFFSFSTGDVKAFEDSCVSFPDGALSDADPSALLSSHLVDAEFLCNFQKL